MIKYARLSDIRHKKCKLMLYIYISPTIMFNGFKIKLNQYFQQMI